MLKLSAFTYYLSLFLKLE